MILKVPIYSFHFVRHVIMISKPSIRPLISSSAPLSNPSHFYSSIAYSLFLIAASVFLLVFLFFFNFIYFFKFLAALGLCCYVWAFSSCGKRGLLFIVMRGLLIAVASLVEHGL